MKWSLINTTRKMAMKHICIFFFLLISLFGVSDLKAHIAVTGDFTHEYTVEPNQTIKGEIPITNFGNEPITAKIFIKDYLFYCNGENHYLEKGTTKRSNGNWLQLSASSAEIPPGQSKNIHYTLKVPNGTSMQGTYWSMILVEPEEKMNFDLSENQAGIQTVIRYGIQMITHLGSSGDLDLKITNKELVEKENQKFLEVHVENSGSRLLRPEVWAEFYDDEGESCGTFGGQKKRIFPTCSAAYLIDLEKLEKKKYEALLIIDDKDQAVFGAQYSLDLTQ